MEKEMQEIIKKNLPAQVGDALKTRLEQAEKDADTVKRQAEQILSKEAIIRCLEKIVSDYREFDARNVALEGREKAVADSERNLKIATLEFQLAAEKEKTTFSKEVALGLVRNTEYRKNVFDNENQSGYYDGNNHWVMPTPINKSLTEDKKAI